MLAVLQLAVFVLAFFMLTVYTSVVFRQAVFRLAVLMLNVLRLAVNKLAVFNDSASETIIAIVVYQKRNYIQNSQYRTFVYPKVTMNKTSLLTVHIFLIHRNCQNPDVIQFLCTLSDTSLFCSLNLE